MELNNQQRGNGNHEVREEERRLDCLERSW